MFRKYFVLICNSAIQRLFSAKALILFVSVLLVIACNNKSLETNIENESVNYENTDSVKLDSLTILIQENPKNDKLYAERSVVYQDLGQRTKSLNDLTIANNIDSLNVEYIIQLSDIYLQFGKSHISRDLLLRANKLEDKNIQVLYRLGNLYFYIQDYKVAIEYLKKARDVDPFFAPVYFTYGMIKKELGDTATAIEQFQIAVEREPNYYDAYIVLGALHSQLKDSVCLDYYRNALHILPNSYEAKYAMAMFYQQNEKPEQALQIYKTIVNNNNAFPNVYFNMGYVEMIFFNEYNTANSYFDSAIAIQPLYSSAYSNKGYCFEKLNDKINARKSYQKALEIEPNMEVAVLGLNRLDNN